MIDDDEESEDDVPMVPSEAKSAEISDKNGAELERDVRTDDRIDQNSKSIENTTKIDKSGISSTKEHEQAEKRKEDLQKKA